MKYLMMFVMLLGVNAHAYSHLPSPPECGDVGYFQAIMMQQECGELDYTDVASPDPQVTCKNYFCGSKGLRVVNGQCENWCECTVICTGGSTEQYPAPKQDYDFDLLDMTTRTPDWDMLYEIFKDGLSWYDDCMDQTMLGGPYLLQLNTQFNAVTGEYDFVNTFVVKDGVVRTTVAQCLQAELNNRSIATTVTYASTYNYTMHTPDVDAFVPPEDSGL